MFATSSSDVVVGPINVDGLLIDTAAMGLADVTFIATSGRSSVATLDEPLAFDPVAGRTSTPDYTLALVPGPYTSMLLELTPISPPPAGFPDRLTAGSVVVEGVRADGVAFALVADIDDPIWVNSQGASFQVRGGSQTLFVTFAVDTWLESEDIDQLAGSPDIIIDRTTAPELVGHFEEKLAESVTLYADTDGNGLLDLDGDEVLARGSDDHGHGPEGETDGGQGSGSTDAGLVSGPRP
jgi:hypothetical protein